MMRRNHRLLSGIAALLAVSMLAACGPTANTDGDATPTPGQDSSTPVGDDDGTTTDGTDNGGEDTGSDSEFEEHLTITATY